MVKISGTAVGTNMASSYNNYIFIYENNATLLKYPTNYGFHELFLKYSFLD